MIFKDKIVIVSGGSRGIGKSIVFMLAKEGAKVAFTYLNSDKEANDIAGQTASLPGKAYPYKVDVRDFDKVKEFVEKVKLDLGGIDILVNNAGIVKDRALMVMTKEDWADVINTNLTGVFNFTRNVIVSLLKQKRGDIVNISSVSGVVGMPGQTNYCASKAGIIGFTKALAKEVAPYNIRVNAVAPGFIETDMIANIKPEYKDGLIKSIPLKRFGKPEEVADTVKYLLSQESGFITGQTIILDGGMTV